MSGKTFEFDGEQFAYVTSPQDLTLDEMDVALGWLDEQGLVAEVATLGEPRHRPKMLRVMLWASVHRQRPSFTIIEAGAVTMRIATGATSAPAGPVPTAAEVAVMSPTPAGKRGTRKPASPTSTAAASATPRRSRTSSASARGSSGS